MILLLHRMKHDYIQQIQSETTETVYCLPDFAAAEQDILLGQAKIMIGYGTELTREKLDLCPNLQWFHSLSAGVEELEFDELQRRGILVTNSSGVHGRQMSEQIFGTMLAFTRGLHVHWRNQKNAVWDKQIPIHELYGQTLTIVGAGRIGQEVARKAKAFDMHVIGVKRFPSSLENFDQVVGMDGLHDGLAAGDFVLVLTPLTPETFHLMGQQEFAVMKPSAIFMNYSRGDVVDEEALVEALHTGRIHGAGLDVFHKEPLEPESPLWKLENVLLTPHTSGSSPTYNARALEVFSINYHQYKEGRMVQNKVDFIQKY